MQEADFLYLIYRKKNNKIMFLKKMASIIHGNEHLGSFGCDSYDISGVVVGGSNGSLHGMTKFNMDGGNQMNLF